MQASTCVRQPQAAGRHHAHSDSGNEISHACKQLHHTTTAPQRNIWLPITSRHGTNSAAQIVARTMSDNTHIALCSRRLAAKVHKMPHCSCSHVISQKSMPTALQQRRSCQQHLEAQPLQTLCTQYTCPAGTAAPQLLTHNTPLAQRTACSYHASSVARPLGVRGALQALCTQHKHVLQSLLHHIF
jgi:hypothetical protein